MSRPHHGWGYDSGGVRRASSLRNTLHSVVLTPRTRGDVCGPRAVGSQGAALAQNCAGPTAGPRPTGQARCSRQRRAAKRACPAVPLTPLAERMCRAQAPCRPRRRAFWRWPTRCWAGHCGAPGRTSPRPVAEEVRAAAVLASVCRRVRALLRAPPLPLALDFGAARLRVAQRTWLLQLAQTGRVEAASLHPEDALWQRPLLRSFLSRHCSALLRLSSMPLRHKACVSLDRRNDMN